MKIQHISVCLLAIVTLASSAVEAAGFDGVYRLPPIDQVVHKSPVIFRAQSASTLSSLDAPATFDMVSMGGGAYDEGSKSKGRAGWLTGAQVFVAGDAWAARLDDDDWNNFGARAGFNTAFGRSADGIQGQVGAAYGVYDWDGHEMGDTRDNEEQIFVTLGAFRRANPCEGRSITWGVVWDYLHDENVGEEHNQSIDMNQVRFRLGYARDEANEFGVKGAFVVDGGEQFMTGNSGVIPVNTAQHVSAYWEHVFCSGARTMVYGGWLEEPGEMIVGVRGEVPLSERISMFGLFHYGKPSTSAGDFAPNGVEQSYSEAYWNVQFGFSVYLRGQSPLMPVADNSTFMIGAPVGAL